MITFQHRLHIGIRAVIVSCIVLAAATVATPHASAAPTVAITAPAAGAQLPVGQPVTVSGTASANTTVLVKNGTTVVGSTISNGSGVWSVVVSGLPAGSATLTAEAIQNSTYGYFGTVGGTNQIHRLRLSDYALNPGGGAWPVTSTILPFIIQPVDYALNSLYLIDVGNQTAPAKFSTAAPADPVATTGFPAATTVYSGDSNAAGTKMYVPIAEANAISVIDVTSNTQITTIPIGGVSQSVRRGPNGYMYASDTTNNEMEIIDPTSDTVISTFSVSCPTVGSVGAAFYYAPNDYMLVTCALDGIIRKLRISDHVLLESWNISASLPSISNMSYSLDGKKIYVSGIVAIPGSDKIAVIDATTGTVTATIPLTAETLTANITPDGQYLFAPTPGSGFSTMNIDVISTQTNTVVANIDTSAFGLPGLVAFGGQTASTTVNFSLINSSLAAIPQPTLADTGESWTWVVFGALSMLGVGLSLMYIARRNFLS